MKNILLMLIPFLNVVPVFAQEVTLFDSNGAANAYIDYNDNGTIYLWDGTPVAFLKTERAGDITIFDFNGNFLGWYEAGIIFNREGYPVGARRNALAIIPQIEPIKYIKQITLIRPITSISPIKPIFYNSGFAVRGGYYNGINTGAAQVLPPPTSDPLYRFYRAKNAGTSSLFEFLKH